jgi:cyclic beta-1,2-glucan synthetase
LPALLAIFIAMNGVASARAEGPAVRLAEATELGTFNVGPARADVRRAHDREGAGDVLKLEYTIPRGAAAGLYAKSFPGGLDSRRVDAVRLAVRAEGPDPSPPIVVAVEIKGHAGVQRIPLEVHPQSTPIEAMVDWPAIGALKEVVVSVNPAGDAGPAAGTIAIDGRFERLPMLRKLGLSPVWRLGGVLLVGLLLAMLTALMRAVSGRAAQGGPTPAAQGFPGRESSADSGWLRPLRGDLVRGAGAVFIALLAIEIAGLGARGPLEAGWTALWVGMAGVAVAEWWKYGLNGRHLTPGEVFQDLVATGLPAASSSAMAILQAPAAWPDLLSLSQVVAAAVTLAYHAANASRLASTGRHLGPAGAALIVGTPYVVGGLTMLESGGLLQALGGYLTAGALSAHPDLLEFVGRVLVILVFNEAVASGLGLATRRTLLKAPGSHLMMLAVAAAAVAAPRVAALGSSPLDAWPIVPRWIATLIAAWPTVPRWIATVLTTMLSQAGLWAEAYLITGMAMDAIHGQAPSRGSVREHPVRGMTKGMVYSGTFMGILHALGALGEVPLARWAAASQPVLAAALFGALTFPLVKTIIETFDGSHAFLRRVRRSYADPTLYLRGAVVGLGLGLGLILTLAEETISTRAWFGFAVGAAAFAGIDLLRDGLGAARGRRRVQSPRYYLVHALLGGAIGAAVGFYLDASQLAIVTDNFHSYLAAGQAPRPFEVYPLVSKWGHLHLGVVTGGVSLLFAQALAGVISWSTAAWLFAINRTFLTAFFQRDTTPIRTFFTQGGLAQLAENMIVVLRWGLWMSPIINSFLRPMGEPTWYNQDGAVRTAVAIVRDATSSHEAFRAWSLQVFIYLLAYDAVRILIWLDHMGLRVATLVNLSFLGMDKLDQRLARLLAPAATARCIPEGVKRFTTWGPLLIPYYIPRGPDWDRAWSAAESIRSHAGPGLLAEFHALPVVPQQLLVAGAVVAATAVSWAIRRLKARFGTRSLSEVSLGHTEYEVTLREDGAVVGRVPGRDYDVSRRSYDLLDPAGRALFLAEADDDGRPHRAWPIVGNIPGWLGEATRIEGDDPALRVVDSRDGLRATVEITIPAADDPVELWTINVENLTDAPRAIKVVPYLEWVLNRPEADRNHTQYNRLFAEVEYVAGLQGVLAWDKHAKAMGLLASDRAPEGFLSARIDFHGRARSLGRPRVLETLAFAPARDTAAHPTLDPIGSLLIALDLPARGSGRVRLLIGLAGDKARAIDLIARHLQLPRAASVSSGRDREPFHPIGHGEIPPGRPRPYCEFSEDGRRMLVRTPMTPRPFDHTLSNALGHVVVVTNRGLHTTSNVNAQQNRLTPDWSDIVTREVPSEAFYLYDPDAREWFSPAYHPLNDDRAALDAEFGVDGTASFRMARGSLETELTVFVPPGEPAGVYLLTVRNHTDAARRLRLAPYFQLVLAGQPEFSGPLRIRREDTLGALFFENPRNTYRTGPAFVAASFVAERVETRRDRFFGGGRDVARPYLVERGEPDLASDRDDRPIAALLTTLDLPPRGERTIVVILGQADDRGRAEAVIRRYRDLDAAHDGLEETRRWWLALMDTLRVQTSSPELDRTLDWLKYQALAERIFARRGFYQASGAYGFRDQLQDSVNLIWMEPRVARRQILLHAAQQFTEGDVVHWFHRLQDGRTGFVGRTHASDNLLWLAWGVVEYVGATGDDSLLDEPTPYLDAGQPFEPLPAGKHGMGFDPFRSTQVDTVYGHCLAAIDLVLGGRMGAHGLPLMGTGDWNDGLDEIGSQGRGESVWLGFFLSYILDRMAGIVERKEGRERQEYYLRRLRALNDALELTWRGDRYLRAIHDDGTEIGVKGSGVWEIDALTAAWAVIAGINPQRGRVVFETALRILEQETTILLGWPPLREDTRPYLGRSSWYPEGVRENGMYCHGVQWLVGAARILAEQAGRDGRPEEAREYLETASRLWLKISPIPHTAPGAIETYGGQPNQQAADMVTTFDPGRMIWNGYTGAAGWMFRQALEGVLGLRLVDGTMVPPPEIAPAAGPRLVRIARDTTSSPLPGPAGLQPPAQRIAMGRPIPRR